jgi:pimeloyl-ACP methyl ester carboxylesterase
MPFYQKGDVRIRYEETGSGFPLLVIPGGGLNSRISNWSTAVINAMEAFKNDFRCITMDQRNANGGESTGPVPVDNPWDAFADDQLGLMDHLGIREFFFMGYCIGGCFAGKLLQRAPDRVLAAVFCQTVGHRPENPTVMYRHSKDNWEPDFLKRRPDVSPDTIEQYFHNLYAVQPDFLYSVSRNFIRNCRTPMLVLPDDVPDLDRCRLTGDERRDHSLSVEGAGGTETTHDRPGAAFPQGAHPDARRRAIGGLAFAARRLCNT